MTNNTVSGSATIYAFPPRGRFAAAGQSDDLARPAAAAWPRGVTVASGGGWYHDEAIRADSVQRGRKN